MLDAFKIWIERLKNGETQKIDGSFDPSFLDIQEQELDFFSPIQVKGEAYLANDHLVIHLHACTKLKMPCSICNEMIQTELTVKDFYQTEPIKEYADGLFDLSVPLREAICIEIPRRAECNHGNCPQRDVIAPYLKQEIKRQPDSYFPFADLEPKP